MSRSLKLSKEERKGEPNAPRGLSSGVLSALGLSARVWGSKKHLCSAPVPSQELSRCLGTCFYHFTYEEAEAHRLKSSCPVFGLRATPAQ